MKKKEKDHSKWYSLETILIYLAILFIIFVIFASDFEKNCNYDTECFKAAASECKQAKLNVVTYDNTYLYEIKSKEKDSCMISIKLVKLSQNTPSEIVDLFDQKEMICTIPQSELNIDELIEKQGISDYCSGPLKEAMYELIIKRMYDVIAKNFGPIIKEIDKLKI